MKLSTGKSAAVLMAAFLLTGCTTNVTINEETPPEPEKQTETENNSQTENQKPGSGSDQKDNKDNKDNKKETAKTDEKKPSSGSSEEEKKPDSENEKTKEAADTFGKQIYAEFKKAGYKPGQAKVNELDNGNIETVFEAEAEGSTVTVYATDIVSVDLAQKTFDANAANAEAYDSMTVMEKATSGNRTVEVVRNNMANINFVIGMDKDAPSTIYIIDQTPEQMQPILELLTKVGYPLAE